MVFNIEIVVRISELFYIVYNHIIIYKCLSQNVMLSLIITSKIFLIIIFLRGLIDNQ